MFFKSLKKVALSFVLLIGIFSFSKTKNTTSSLNLANINVIEELSNQEFECRPSSKFLFYVETKLERKLRGANEVNVNVFIFDRSSGKSNLLTSENILVHSQKDMVLLDFNTTKSQCKKTVLENGDKILGNSKNYSYCFNELIKFKPIYNSYINATNKLLKQQRSII